MKWLLVLLFCAPLSAQDDWKYTSARYEAPMARFKQDYVDGAWKGEFIQKPNFANILGNLSVNFTPAAPFADFRDLFANIKNMVNSNFQNHKTDVALAVGGFIPAAGEGKKIVKAFEAGKEFRLLQKAANLNFAPAIESGLTRKLQASISLSVGKGEIIAIRPRVYQANFMDGKLPVKEAHHVVDSKFNNGVRVLTDGNRVISDVDVAFVAKNTRILPEAKTHQIGNRINDTYGHRVVVHGDNFSGARKGIDKAIEIENKNERVYLFNKGGYVDSGNYLDMLRKWGSR